MNNCKWISAWCSKTGSSHIQEDLPCQDSSKVRYIEETDFIIAAVSDGAGSCENSHLGSSFLVIQAVEKITVALKKKNWLIPENSELDSDLWREEAFNLFRELKDDLKQKAIESGHEFRSLSATLIVAVSNGRFIACANVGDGRAAFRNKESDWLPMMVPAKGEEANQTIFITSDFWDEDIDSGYFGTFFCKCEITALTLLSDGCERASFEILKYNEEKEKFFDPNKPFKPFFEPNYLNLLKLKESNIDQEMINDLWGDFLEKGNQQLLNETDDKSMILSVFLSSQNDDSNS